MKFLKLNLLLLWLTVIMVSCKKESTVTPNPTSPSEVENLRLVKSFINDSYVVELYNNSGQLKVGYNKLYLRFKNKNGQYITETQAQWLPMMTMSMGGSTMQHSCPFSTITKVSGKQTLFEGYIVFIMASNGPDNFWDLKTSFTIENQSIEVHDTISVVNSDSDYSKIYTSGMGSDGKKYMLALVEPTNPKIGANDIVVALFEKGTGNFPIVNNYTIKVDSRMPGMNNHSAPGNQDMTQGTDGFYHGKVGFSMSGYWKINLILVNSANETVKGEAITDQTLESSLQFKLEF